MGVVKNITQSEVILAAAPTTMIGDSPIWVCGCSAGSAGDANDGTTVLAVAFPRYQFLLSRCRRSKLLLCNGFFMPLVPFAGTIQGMEDVSAIRYLTTDRSGKKLRRAVPKELQKLAGRSAWVERVQGTRLSDIRERANLFAARTDAEIKSLRLRAKSDPQEAADADGTNALNLSRAEVQQVAIRFFWEQEARNTENGDYFADSSAPDFADILGDAGEAYAAAHREAAGVERYSDRTALKALVDFGYLPAGLLVPKRRYKVPEELRKDRVFQFLCRLIERAQVELAQRRLGALQNGTVPPIADPLFAAGGAIEAPRLMQNGVAGPDKTIRDLIAHFVEWKSPKVGQSRMGQFRLAIRAMEEQWGERTQLAAITRQHCQELATLFPRVPPYVLQHYKGMTLAAAVEAYESKQGKPADRFAEAQNHLSALREILERAVQQDWIAVNPAARVEAPGPKVVSRKFHEKGNGYEPFSVDDLGRIFSAPLYTGCVDDERHFNQPGNNIVRRHRFWVPLIALWTGARLGEILQLEKADVRQDESGIWYLAITDEEAAEYDPNDFQKRLKTKNSIRDIPIHSELQRLGFISWVSARPDGRLFPEAQAAKNGKLSDVYSKWFKRFLEFQGVWGQRRKVFHSFRNSFNDALREAGVPSEIREAINGWSSQQAMDARYGSGHKVHRLAEHVEKVTYEGLDLSHLYPSDPS